MGNFDELGHIGLDEIELDAETLDIQIWMSEQQAERDEILATRGYEYFYSYYFL
jgi:hypothetical protein